ncbi:uncharacterized protein TNCT_692561 [Trichonephila clavata]|uniref:Pre-C2HC domain-containing protein n=1 Tax=Trichonephila clavata TaxID=2740835 RepID=A0A8X6HBX4_TRICU|nr:uncharacterized protein TNCT_692561 [Trichonephila clavata]
MLTPPTCLMSRNVLSRMVSKSRSESSLRGKTTSRCWILKKESPNQTMEATQKLEEETASITEMIAFLEVLKSEKKDVEDVTPTAPKIHPIMMKLTPNYNLTLQDLYKSHPITTNTHTAGYIKIQRETEEHRREITDYLTYKKIEHYVTDPPENRPLKLLIKGLLASTDPEEIKTDLINQGIKIEKIAQLRSFKTKNPLPIFMIEITRDENVNDFFKIRSCLYMQLIIDSFNKSSRLTQCFNCIIILISLSRCPKLQNEYTLLEMW